MKNVIVIGANGRTGRQVIQRLVEQDDVARTLFLRHAERLTTLVPEAVTLIEGDAHDAQALEGALAGQDIVIVTLGGMDLDVTTQLVVDAAQKTGARRIVTISAGGIYDELPEPFNAWDVQMVGQTRPVNRRAADIVERSSLDYTILRPVWLTDKNITEVNLTRKGETYRGTETSRASLGAFIAGIVADPSAYVGENLGLTQPGTDGERPAAY